MVLSMKRYDWENVRIEWKWDRTLDNWWDSQCSLTIQLTELYSYYYYSYYGTDTVTIWHNFLAFLLLKCKQNTDLKYKLTSRIRSRINHALNGRVKDDSLKDLLGCDMNEYKIYLEKRFDQHMTWDNYGEWHIDHIIPLSSAKNDDELKNLCHYSNLQPLWAIENIIKRDKII